MGFPAAGLPAFEPPASVGALALVRAFRENLLGVFSANFFVEPRVSFRRFGHRFVCLSDPDDIDHVLNTHMHRYEPNVLARRLLEPIVGQGLLFAEGDEWRRQRLALAPFFQPRNLGRLIPVVHETVASSLGGWPAGRAFKRDLLADFRKLTLAVIARALLSIDDERGTAALAEFASSAEGAGELLEWRDYLALLVWKRAPQPPGRVAVAAQWRNWVGSLVDGRRRSEPAGQARDMIDVLLSVRDGGAGGPIARDEIVDQVGTMLSAGFITTAIALFWTFLMLARFPAHQEAVRRELLQTPSDEPDFAALRAAPFATAFLYETLRLYPPAYVIAREARVEDRIDRLRIPRGAAVIVAPWVVHRHRALWPEPGSFDPNRFLHGGRLTTPPAWMPFGAGPRVCIGAAFATMEILVVLRRLLSRYAVTLEGPLPRPIGRITLVPEFRPQFTLTPL